jgi:hypothetical protein
MLNNIGFIYSSLGDYQTALDYYERSLSIRTEIGDRRGEGDSLNNIGFIYSSLGQYQKALGYYERSLSIRTEIGDRRGEGDSLNNIGYALENLEEPELAIVFLKQSVNQYEDIRGDLRGLATEQQQSFTNTVADTYRFLADLLLEQGRIPEAQQVLDLLKLEELREFTHTTRATWNGTALAYTDPEQAVKDAHGSLIALSGEILSCEANACAELETLYAQLEGLKDQYAVQVTEFNEAIRNNRAEDDIFQAPDNLSGDAEELLAAYATEGENALLIYPFVLEDKLWLVWAAAGNVIGSIEVSVTQGELAKTV